MLSRLRRALPRDVFRHGFLVLCATVLVNLGSFIFHAIVSRKLGVAAYGSLYALVSFVQLASLPAGIFTTVIAKFAAEFRALNDPVHLRALTVAVCKIFGAGMLLYLVVGALLSQPIAEFLRVPGWAVVVTSAISGAIVFVYAIRAIPQGTQDFKSYSAALVIDGGLKATLGAAVSTAKFGLAGGVVGFFAGSVLSGLYVSWRLWNQYATAQRIRFVIDRQRVLFTTLGAAALTTSTTILSYADVIVVKHYFPAHEAGIYAAASLAGKILFFVVGFAPAILIPKAADSHSRGKSASGALIGTLLMVGALSALGFIAFVLGGKLVLHVLVGGQFGETASILPMYGLAMAILGITNVIGSYSIALHRFGFGIPLTGVAIAEIAAIFLYHPTLQSVVLILVFGNAIALAAVSVCLNRPSTPSGRASAQQRPALL